jgi:hypothetical protein
MVPNNQSARTEIKQKFIERLIACFLDIIILTRFYDHAFNSRDVVLFVKKQFGSSINSSKVHSTIHAMERKELITSVMAEGTLLYRLTEKGKLTVEVTTEGNEIKLFMQKLMVKKSEGSYNALGP